MSDQVLPFLTLVVMVFSRTVDQKVGAATWQTLEPLPEVAIPAVQLRLYGTSGQLVAVVADRLEYWQTVSEVTQRWAGVKTTLAAGSRPARASASW